MNEKKKDEILTDLVPKRLSVSIAKMFLLLGLLWILFYTSYRLLPYIRAGAVIIYEAKTNEMLNSLKFPQNAKYKIVICGNSKILSGFIPNIFDSTDEKTYSYNLGLPDAENFLFTIEHLIRCGQTPTHVFLTIPWPDDGESNKSFALFDDIHIMETLFPFKTLPRDLILFLLRSRTRGGLGKFYQFGKDSVTKMLADNGYYFIEGQSHFPNHQLPEGFKLQADTPDKTRCRTFYKESSTFKKLIELHEKYNINFYIVPIYYRSGSVAQYPAKNENAAVFNGYPGLHILGPEYYLFSNKNFSDPTHLNPEGAKLYTKKLRQLFEENIMGQTIDSSLVKLH